ncbi:MAG: Pectin degradation repressor protein KdgR [Alphaproteobacteria bacterium MarineAlpha5_Bin6]|nr:MAG: Pectin degradation repressor protein KdgR [Alphaproteobacteria bacterium MarineAlpha5_Bin6]|tara:strand:+ start:2472 stop:3275 length:804 start_codon:yes stop_codon:yes gene_type:complete
MSKLSYRAPALDKGLDIIELLALSAEGLTQAQIANHLQKSVNEIYRMLNTLKERGYVEFEEKSDQYKLSFKLLNLAATFDPTKSLLEKANPIMKEIAAMTNQSIHLSIYTAGKLLVIAQCDSGSPFNYHVPVGSTFDLLETSSGRVLLTFQSDQERKRRLDRRKLFMKIEKTSKLPLNQLKEIEKKFSKQTVHRIKKDGCEIVKSLQIVGITNISYPIIDHTCYALAAITIPYLNRLSQKNEINIKETSKILEKYSAQLSKELGFNC